MKACHALSCRFLVIPLVDNGAVATAAQEDDLVSSLLALRPTMRDTGTAIAFESDYEPERLARFIERFPDRDLFGINYDIGNSAALGYSFERELAAYAPRITNVHIKDRVLGGTTVPLGEGAARLPETLNALRTSGYDGNYILQTARASDGDHRGALERYAHLACELLR
mgnify:CR=1 FL=1